MLIIINEIKFVLQYMAKPKQKIMKYFILNNKC